MLQVIFCPWHGKELRKEESKKQYPKLLVE